MKALVIGGTGLVGSKLIDALIEDDRFDQIIALTRREKQSSSKKLTWKLVDFDDQESLKTEIKGDVLFSCLGTTRAKAGSKKAQYQVDYSYQYNCASLAASNDVKQLVLISSLGADDDSLLFYPKTKGKLDRDVQSLGFDKVSILRPSVLDGDRGENRAGEKLAIQLGNAFCQNIPFLRKYQPIKDSIVARAMINAALKQTDKNKIYESLEVFELADR